MTTTKSEHLPQRFVVIAGYAPSLVNFRGPLLRALRAQGHQVIALAPGEAPEVQQTLASWGVHYFPISLERTGMDPRRDSRDMAALTERLRELRPDAVLAYTIKPIVYGLLAARAAGVARRYALVTGLGYSFQGEGLKRKALSQVTGQLYRAALLGARRVIFQNPDDRNLFVERGLVRPEQTTIVNGSGVDLAHYAPAPLPDAPIFLLIARLLREKGVVEYVEAARQLRAEAPNARFLLAGPLDSNPSSVSAAELEGWVAEGTVEYLGELKDVRPALAQSSVYVLPSYREGTPRTVLEAMALGRPVVTTDAPGCRETVEPGVNGLLVPVADVPKLVGAMREMLDADKRQAMGAASLALARRKYDVNVVNGQMLEALDLSGGPRTEATVNDYDTLKRALDIAVSGAGLVTLSLPLAALAWLVQRKLGSPVLFKQTRPGLNGQPFTMYKFRTMTDERGPDGELLPDAQRLTPFGKFLRSSSLDELPELWNVLRGDMSLVGPRPLLMSYLPLYSEKQARRHEVRPGITGWAQVNGRNALSWPQKFEYDVWYVDHRDLALDLRILWLTVQKVFKREGISAAGEATMPPFRGETE